MQVDNTTKTIESEMIQLHCKTGVGGDGDNTEIYMDQGQPVVSTPLRC